MNPTWYLRYKQIQRHPLTRVVLFVAMFLVLAELTITSVSANQVELIGVDRALVMDTTLDRLADWTGIDYDSGLDYEDRLVARSTIVILDVRWPRVVMALFVGAGLGLSGAVLQGVFRNPLADPGLIGVSSGAAMAAVIAILQQADLTPLIEQLESIEFFRPWAEDVSGRRLAEALAAAIGGLLMTLLVYRLSRVGGRTDTTNLLLVGLAVNSIGGAVVGLATFIGNERRTSDITFWSLGSLKDLQWGDVYVTVPIILIGMLILPFFSRQLNIMTLGENEAQNLGINTTRLRQLTIALSALMIGVSVGFAGIITFIGLVVPHVMRVLFGPDHRFVLPASMLGGAIFLVAADMYGRTLPSTNEGVTLEVPVGVLTAMIGGPFFLLLILFLQRRRGQF